MSLTFAKAPLVEIVVELRWIPPQTQIGGAQSPSPQISVAVPFFSSSKLDEFFMRVGIQLHQHGFTVVERLMPPGFSVLHQPVYRYRKGADPSVLVQAGDGIFSIHAIPPYHSWEKFLPEVEKGISALLEARDDTQKKSPFVRVSLRYIDAFKNELRAGLSSADFMSKVLGIGIEVPTILKKLLRQESAPEYGLQIGLPIDEGTTLSLSLSEATVNGILAILMDTTYEY